MKNLDKNIMDQKNIYGADGYLHCNINKHRGIDCKIRIQSFSCTKILYRCCLEFIAGNVSDRDYCILCISFV